MDLTRAGSAALLGGTAVLTLLTAFLASRVDPPANDLVWHVDMVRAALLALQEGRWAAFQNPWCDDIGAGFPMFHVYPHLAHQATAVLAWITGLDAWRALQVSIVAGALLLPGAVYGGGRILGFPPATSLLAAFVGSALASTGAYGHTPLDYWFSSGGLFAQLWGAPLAALALPAVLAACRWDGAGLASLSRVVRLGLAAVLLSLLMRTHLPAGWVTLLLGAVGAAAWGPIGELPGRLVRLTAIYAVALLLSAGFLVPFAVDIGAVNSPWISPELERSFGAAVVLPALARGSYLDGGVPGIWTLSLALGSVWVVVELVRSRGRASADPAIPRLRLLLALAWLSVALFCGRETWGDWVDGVPMAGRFHDQRYLLGLHLVAPWALAGSWMAVWTAARTTRLRPVVMVALVLCLGAAGVFQGVRARSDLRIMSQVMPDYRGRVQTLEPLLAPTRAPDARLALGAADPVITGTTRVQWLRSRGGVIQGQSGQTFAQYVVFENFWASWIRGEPGFRARSIQPEDLIPAGVTGLLVPEGGSVQDAAGQPWALALEPSGVPGWSLAVPGAGQASLMGGMTLVRSDLLMVGSDSHMDGFQIAWFQRGLHHVGQYPSVDLGVGTSPDPARYQRVVDLDPPDPSVLDGLPAAGDLGTILDADARPGLGSWDARVEVTGDGAWLMLTRAWHPGWRATVDGEPAPVAMLTPGLVGVPLSPGEHQVHLEWPAVPGRGIWAALNTALIALSGLWLLGWWVVRRKAA